MIAASKLEQKIGFDKIRQMIIDGCSTGYGKTRASQENFSTSQSDIELRLRLTDEMRVILMFENSFPDTGFVDCIPFLIPLQNEFTHIDLISLGKLKSSLETLRKILNFFKGCKEGQYPCLHSLTAPIGTFPEVSHRIESILDKYDNVRDNASEDLSKIRREIKDKEGVISKRIQSILRIAQQDGIADQDATVSVRDGKMLIPVSAGNKKKITGIVYDESSSGKTSFIEPIEIVELNNQVRELHFREQREILKILVEFTDFLRPYLPDIIAASEYMGELDFIHSKASVASKMQAGMPIISSAKETILKKGRHPLLEEALRKEGKSIVPLDIVLRPDKRILLISGPNAGGKSVCLKTVGLLQYMLQWGTLIPAVETSELQIFDNIFIDIGDDQSLENDLSTYSSHLTNMREMLKEAGDKSLVLIDEFGSGTEPTAGGAIAEQILCELEGKGSYGVITTHYTNLKFYASNSNGVINGAMMFDTAKIEPLFKLEIGLPGNSFAFELARKIGLPEQTVHGAEERAGSEFVSIERHLRKIARNKRQLEEKLAHIKSTDKTLEVITEKYEKELGEVKTLRKSMLDDAKKEAAEILSEANARIEATIKEIRESQAEKDHTREVRKQLDDYAKELLDKRQSAIDADIEKKMALIVERKRRNAARKSKQPHTPAPGTSTQVEIPIEVGRKVRVKGSDLVGEIVRVSGKKVSVAIGEIISKMDIDKVVGISVKEFKNTAKPSPVTSHYDSAALAERRLNFKPSIDIRGMRLDEAIDVVTRFIDDALMVGMNQVSILHGKGNGVLREEIRKYLKITPGVSSFHDEEIQHGGTGITIVLLK